MILNKRKTEIISGKIEGYSQEEIDRTLFFYNLHRDPVIKIDGVIIGVITEMNIQLNRDGETYESVVYPLDGVGTFDIDFVDFNFDENILKKLTGEVKDEDSN